LDNTLVESRLEAVVPPFIVVEDLIYSITSVNVTNGTVAV
jgi:hypothetical protein